jgi:hypothetical protein
MADITQTPSAVKASAAGLRAKKAGVSGSAFDAGDTVYQAVDGRFNKADANGADPLPNVKGIALCSCPGADQPFFYVDKDPDFLPGGTTVAGTVYVASAAPGKICPAADLASTMKTDYIGTGKTGNKLDLNVRATGIAVP